MAGLMAARVLSDYFASVTILERNVCPAAPAPRTGVPQGQHVHVLLLKGLRVLENLFPGLTEDLLQAGGVMLDSAQDFNWFTQAGWAPRFSSGLPFLAVSRPLLEWHVRKACCRRCGISLVEGVSATGLAFDERSERVTGVHTSAQNTIPGTLVIDATGRGSKLSQWLESLGYPQPPETEVNGHLGYASQIFRRNDKAVRDWRSSFSQAKPPARLRGGLAFPIEGNRWMVTLVGGGRDYPPRDEAGFAEFARSLPNSGTYDVITESEPLSEIHSTRGTQNRMRHFERIKMPAGLLATGDSACCFNPVYGQGMSTAAIGAELLRECLQQNRLDRFQKELAKRLAPAWTFATSEDVRYPGAQGAIIMDRKTRFMHRYIDGVIELSVRNTKVRACLLRVLHMIQSPSLLFRPDIFLRVISGMALRNRNPEKSFALEPGRQPTCNADLSQV